MKPEAKQSRQQRRQREREVRKQARRSARQLRQQQQAQGLKPPSTSTISNATSPWQTVEEERDARQQAVEQQVEAYRSALPRLLRRLEKIRDPRNPKTIRHKLTVLMLYGILVFVYHMSSRREANREMSLPQFQENLQLLFPELESLPHQDTLNRRLARIAVNQIEAALLDLIQHFIRKKKFHRYLLSHCYPIAIDGTQKLVRDWLGSEEWLERELAGPEGSPDRVRQYYVYVLEANLAFPNGMTFPLLSEFLSFTAGDQEKNKQDCELQAFYRLAARLKAYFPRLPILLLLDGLYANGPVMELLRRYRWQYMIVLQNDSLPSVWEEVRGLGRLQPANRWEQNWGNRRQRFRWVNGIEYRYGEATRPRRLPLHVLICEESWQQINPDSGVSETKTSQHVWISSEALCRDHVHERANLGARHRWGIENSILVEKHQGYRYEHCFSYHWTAMKGYHYLMRLGHLLNSLAQNTARLARLVASRGVRGLIQFLRQTCAGPWLDAARIRHLLSTPSQLRLE